MSTTFAPGHQDVDHTDFDEDAWPARGAFRAAVEQVATNARERLPECNGRVDAAVKLVLAGDVELLPDGSAHIFSASQAGTVYHLVNGACWGFLPNPPKRYISAMHSPHGGECLCVTL